MGKDAISGFSEGTVKPNTPNLDRIRTEGLSFNNAWVNPTCSPTRAAIITGKYGYRTGVKSAGDALSTSETILPKFINDQTNNAYATAVVGKWHLAGSNATFNPETLGLDYYAGIMRGGVQDYFDWSLTEDGASQNETEYTSKKFTDLAIDWVANQSKPWLLWLAYNAAHTPFHAPPSEMHSQGNLPEYTAGMDAIPYYMAAIEAMDYQIGKLLESMSEEELDNTIIIFVGDNGTPNQVAQSPYSSNTAKGTLYQGGINTPLFISGAGVTRTGIDNNLICNTDIFSTISDLAGVSSPNIHDAKSFKMLLQESGTHRDFQYSEKASGTEDQWAISNGTFKLMTDSNGDQELYNLNNDPNEGNNLLNQASMSPAATAAKAELEAELLNIRN